jgi:hypothetical protein
MKLQSDHFSFHMDLGHASSILRYVPVEGAPGERAVRVIIPFILAKGESYV